MMRGRWGEGDEVRDGMEYCVVLISSGSNVQIACLVEGHRSSWCRRYCRSIVASAVVGSADGLAAIGLLVNGLVDVAFGTIFIGPVPALPIVDFVACDGSIFMTRCGGHASSCRYHLHSNGRTE